MTDALILAVPPPPGANPEVVSLTPAQLRLRRMTLDSVSSAHSRRNYARALDDLFLFAQSQPLSRELLIEWRTKMESLSPSTINVRLSAVRKMVHEARRPTLALGEESTPRERRVCGFREGERASEGRGCTWRGTLNARQKGKPKGSLPIQWISHGTRL